MPAICCTNISKRYQRAAYGIKETLVGKHKDKMMDRFARQFALKDVGFVVEKGAAFGVVGQNGAGKSTLLSLLLGVIQPDSGDIRIQGRVASLLDLGCGFHPELTGRENIRLYGAILGMSFDYIKMRMNQIIRFSELGEAIDHPIQTYSSGMVARLGFATIINVEADILLIDEVLAVGDSAFQTKCKRYLRQFQENGGTLVIVSHDMDALSSTCDSGICLDRGEVLYAGSIKDVIGAYQTQMETCQLRSPVRDTA